MSPRMALLFLLGLIASANVGLSSAYRHHRSEQGEFLAPQPKEVLSTDGGRVESWEADEFSLLKVLQLVFLSLCTGSVLTLFIFKIIRKLIWLPP